MRASTIAAPLAERRSGLVTRQALRAAGASPSAIDRALDAHALVREAAGVYRVAGAPASARVRLLAQVLALGAGAALSHRSAAWVWGLGDAPVRHEATVPRSRRPQGSALVVHRSRDLHLASIADVDGLPVTDVGRTILDCAGQPGADVTRLIDEARRRHDISRSLLPTTVIAHARRGRAGLGALREALLVRGLPDSDFERLVWRWLTDHGVEGWEPHVRLVVEGYGPVELDVAWPTQRVALELEGADHRDRRIVHDRDTLRQNALVVAGWTLLRATYGRWLADPDGLLSEVERALARAR